MSWLQLPAPLVKFKCSVAEIVWKCPAERKPNVTQWINVPVSAHGGGSSSSSSSSSSGSSGSSSSSSSSSLVPWWLPCHEHAVLAFSVSAWTIIGFTVMPVMLFISFNNNIQKTRLKSTACRRPIPVHLHTIVLCAFIITNTNTGLESPTPRNPSYNSSRKIIIYPCMSSLCASQRWRRHGCCRWSGRQWPAQAVPRWNVFRYSQLVTFPLLRKIGLV